MLQVYEDRDGELRAGGAMKLRVTINGTDKNPWKAKMCGECRDKRKPTDLPELTDFLGFPGSGR